MPESSAQSRNLQWKWVGITFIFYVLLYLLPLIVAAEVFPGNHVIPGVWIFGGIIIVAALAGYVSKGVTIWEPAIAEVGLVVLLFAYLFFFVLPADVRGTLKSIAEVLIIPAVIVFLLSFVGAWLGERAQKLWKGKTPDAT
jgi:hypothetical protein